MECNGDVVIRKEAENKELSEMRGVFDAWSEGELVETCLGGSDDGGRCSRGSMVLEAALGNVGGCVIDGGALERLGGAKLEIGVSTVTVASRYSVGAIGGAEDRVSEGVMHSGASGRCATAREPSEYEYRMLAEEVTSSTISDNPECGVTYS